MRSTMLAVGIGLLLSACATTAKETDGPAAHHGEAVAGKTHENEPKRALQSLLDGNERFVSSRVRAHNFASERKALVAGQHPKAIVLSCSDSRLPPELVFDQTLGELFVVRSAGNVADKIGLASIEYAAEHLHSRLLIVLGHEKCGAVTAAVKGGKMPTANLEALMQEIGPSLRGLKEKYSGDELVHWGVEANVAATADEILERSPLLSHLVKEGELQLVEAVYDLDNGQVRQLAGPNRAAPHAH